MFYSRRTAIKAQVLSLYGKASERKCEAFGVLLGEAWVVREGKKVSR